MTPAEAIAEMEAYAAQYKFVARWLSALSPSPQPEGEIPRVTAWLPSDNLGDTQAQIWWTEWKAPGELHVCIDVDDWLKTRGYSKAPSPPVLPLPDAEGWQHMALVVEYPDGSEVVYLPPDGDAGFLSGLPWNRARWLVVKPVPTPPKALTPR